MVTKNIMALLLGFSALIYATDSGGVGKVRAVDRISKSNLAGRLSSAQQKLKMLLLKPPAKKELIAAALNNLEKADSLLKQALTNKQLKNTLKAEIANDEDIADCLPNIILESQSAEIGAELLKEVELYFLSGQEQAKEAKKQKIYQDCELTDANVLDKGGQAALTLAAHSNLADALFLFKIVAEKCMKEVIPKRASVNKLRKQEKEQKLAAGQIISEVEKQCEKLATE